MGTMESVGDGGAFSNRGQIHLEKLPQIWSFAREGK